MNDEEKKEIVWKFLVSFFGLFVSLVTGLITWIIVEIHGHDIELANIRSTRCTNSECNSIERDLDRLSSRMDTLPGEIPPKWIRDLVEKNKDRITALEYQCGLADTGKRK